MALRLGEIRKAWLERGQNLGTCTELGRNLNDTYLCKAHQGHQEAVKIVFDARERFGEMRRSVFFNEYANCMRRPGCVWRIVYQRKCML